MSKPKREGLMRNEIKTSIVIALIVLTACWYKDVEVTHSGPVTQFALDISENHLTAGFNNTVKIELTNNGENVYDVDVALTLPPPLTLSGDNHWRAPSIKKNSSLTIEILVYAPTSAIGNTFTASVVLTYKELGYVYHTSEMHSIGFVVHGWVKMVAYGVTVSPEKAEPGTDVTISANLLNQGNVAAMYVNVSLLPAEALVLHEQSTSYVGQVDPNSPAPFSLAASVDPNARNGSYIVRIAVFYQDDRHLVHTFTVNAQFEVVQPSPKPPPSTRMQFEEWLWRDGWIYLSGTVIVILAAILLIRRARRKQPQLGVIKELPTKT